MSDDLNRVTKIGRLTHFHPALGVESYEQPYCKLPVVPSVEANVVSSLLTNGKHAPAIDIDLPIHVMPSRTPGHSHLYIDHELTWEQYLSLLRAFVDVGLVEAGYYEAAKVRGTTLLRVPLPDQQ